MEAHPHHHRGEQEQRLPQQHRLGLDPPDAPAQHPDAVDHRGVRVGPHQGVEEGDSVAHLHHPGEVLEIDLVADPHPRRDHPKAVERLLRPFEQLVALGVALVLALDVGGVGVTRPEGIDLHGVVDHQVRRDQRVDARGVAAHARHRRPHRRQVDDRGNAGEVLEQHS